MSFRYLFLINVAPCVQVVRLGKVSFLRNLILQLFENKYVDSKSTLIEHQKIINASKEEKCCATEPELPL